MPFFNFNTKPRVKIWEGINGSLFDSEQVTFAHIIIDEGAILPEHQHPHEQWTHMIEGELAFNIGGETQILLPGITAFIPGNTPHSARALKKCKVIDCFHPVREDFVALETK